MLNFFSLNYLCFALSFLLQIIIIRFFGQEVYGYYAIYLAFMALIEGPLISARAEISIEILNSSSNRLKSIEYAIKKDFLNSIYIAPLIFGIFYTKFDFDLAIYTFLAIILQSGYAQMKSYLIVTDKIIQTSLFELMIASLNIIITLISYFVFNLNSFEHLVILYCYFAFQKTFILFILIYKSESYELKNERETSKTYCAFNINLIIRSLSINALTNLDIIILSMLINVEVVALYKIIKSLTGLSFRFVAPLWRWGLFSSNNLMLKGDLKGYYKSHFDRAKIAVIFLFLLIFIFSLSITFLVYILYDIEIVFERWFLFTIINAYVTNWFIAWFKIDMLYRAKIYLTLFVPLLISIVNSLIIYFVENFSFKIYYSCFVQVLFMLVIFFTFNNQNIFTNKFPLKKFK